MARTLKTNKVIVKNNITYVYPTNYEHPIMIDTEDYEKIKNYCWSVKKDSTIHIYARARERGSKRFVLMHRILLNEPSGKLIDHKNHNTLDNRKENLKICSNSENNKNKIKYAYKGRGVTYDKAAPIRPWKAMYCNKYIGWFKTKEEAVKAREDYLKENNIYVAI